MRNAKGAAHAASFGGEAAGKRALGKGSTSRTPVITNTLLLTCGLNIEGVRVNEDSLVNQ
jgi:hypothetical protein